MSAEFPAPGRYTPVVFALLRFVSGALYACHGAQKLFGAFGATPAGNTMMMIAGIIEFGGGILIAFGLFTRVAAFIASGQMAAAYFMAHAPQGFWPIENKGELAAVYAFLFLFFAVHGPGLYSLDAAFRRTRGRAPAAA